MKSYKITVNGQSYDVTVEEVGAVNAAAPTAAGRSTAAAAVPAATPAPSAANAGTAASSAAPSGGALVKAPMPGTLLAYKVAQGQAVKKGEVLLILEAMKMENEIAAPVDGVVKELKATEGASVSAGEVLVEIT